MTTAEIGRMGEAAAAEFLRRKGYEIAELNYRSKFGEIDIIAKNDKYLLFVEVKTRSENSLMLPCEAVDIKKQRKILKTAAQYLYEADLQLKFDVIEVYIKRGTRKVTKINHIEDAFDGRSLEGEVF